jgi:phosphoesterase RecJ-like protein
LTTHVNADGDGVGSEVALWHLLRQAGTRPFLVNPTPIPERFQFLLSGARRADRTARAVRELARADVIVVLDIADLDRLGHLGQHVGATSVPVCCIDHHLSRGSLPPGPRLVDNSAAATAELVFDLATVCGWTIPPAAARALYVGLLTDTGGFRFSNTSPRALRVAAALFECGVRPEQIYEQVYANAPEGRVRLLAESLDTLVVEPDCGLAWITVPPGAMERHGATADDLDGIAEFARSIRGVRMAALFRLLASGRVKVSLRSMGRVDVAAFALQFGGGGHARAAGASLPGPLDAAQRVMLTAARAYLRTLTGGARAK